MSLAGHVVRSHGYRSLSGPSATCQWHQQPESSTQQHPLPLATCPQTRWITALLCAGIGEACARLFAAEGACVVLADMQDEQGQKVAEELGQGRAVYIHCNVAQEADVQRAVAAAAETFGRPLWCMVNNAGATPACGSGAVCTRCTAGKHVWKIETAGSRRPAAGSRLRLGTCPDWVTSAQASHSLRRCA